MSIFSKIFPNILGGVKDVAEVFHANESENARYNAERFQSSLRQFSAEFQNAPMSRFQRFIDALNRLPRPLMALGTIGLFVYALYAPENFIEKMMGLATIPEPLWWIMGAIISFYFGAREMHYARMNTNISREMLNKMHEFSKNSVQNLNKASQSEVGKETRSNNEKTMDKTNKNITGNEAIDDWLALSKSKR